MQTPKNVPHKPSLGAQNFKNELIRTSKNRLKTNVPLMCLIGSTKLRDMSQHLPKYTSTNWCKLQTMSLLCAGLGAPNLECRLDDKNPTCRLVDENPTFRLDDENPTFRLVDENPTWRLDDENKFLIIFYLHFDRKSPKSI